MLKSMSWIKTIAINLTLVLAFLGLLFLAPPIIFIGYQIAIAVLVDQTGNDSRAYLPNNQNISWAEKHFEEFNKLKTTYYDFIVWRRDDFNGETISIKKGLRRTLQAEGAIKPSLEGSQAWFFGGSTTWGTGLNDEYTYPSMFAIKTGYHVTNFGETGYSVV